MSLKIVGESTRKNHQLPLPIVAIDGPAGAGKSTAARWLAFQLNFRLIDTGALYRSLALTALDKNISLSDAKALGALCSQLKFQFGALEKPGFEEENIPKLHIFCDGIEVTRHIRTPEVGMAASNISKFPEVREALLGVQRDFGREGGIVMEGRDIGTVIFPEAELKFYLTASIESRAQRRWEELKNSGLHREFDQILRETKQRDEQDMNREVAPLKQAQDAILIDSSNRSLEEVVSEMYRHVRDFLKTSET